MEKKNLNLTFLLVLFAAATASAVFQTLIVPLTCMHAHASI